MAYQKQTWRCGEVVTADKLNHMEDGIENANSGYSCVEEAFLLTDEEVTTVMSEEEPFAIGELPRPSTLPPDSISEVRITFNGTEYTFDWNGEFAFGASYDASTGTMNWTEYPFSINGNFIATEAPTTISVKIEAIGSEITTTSCFREAVKSVGGGCGATVDVNVPRDDVTIYSPASPYGVLTNTSAITIEANGSATFNVTNPSEFFSIVGFDAGVANVLVECIVPMGEHVLLVQLHNLSNTAVTIDARQCIIYVIAFESVETETYTLCGSVKGDDSGGGGGGGDIIDI